MSDEVPVRPSRIQLIPFDKITLGTARRYLVKGLVPLIGLSVVWGAPKTGKSFWVFDLAMHVALGWLYRGRSVQPGPVVYCAFEGLSGLEARIEAFRQKRLTAPCPPIPFFLQTATLDLVADHPELIAVIRRQDIGSPVVVVLDTLNRSLVGSESNDQDMAAYVRAADAIRDAFNCAVIVIHHCGHDGSRPRGHSSLIGAADAQIAVSRDTADNIIATVELSKDGIHGDSIRSRLEVVEVGKDQDGEPITSCIVVPANGNTMGGQASPTGAAKNALEVLRRVIADVGTPASDGMPVPLCIRTVPVSVWRAHYMAEAAGTGNNPDSRRRAFGRSLKMLRSLGRIGYWEDRVWVVEAKPDSPDTAGHR